MLDQVESPAARFTNERRQCNFDWHDEQRREEAAAYRRHQGIIELRARKRCATTSGYGAYRSRCWASWRFEAAWVGVWGVVLTARLVLYIHERWVTGFAGKPSPMIRLRVCRHMGLIWGQALATWCLGECISHSGSSVVSRGGLLQLAYACIMTRDDMEESLGKPDGNLFAT